MARRAWRLATAGKGAKFALTSALILSAVLLQLAPATGRRFAEDPRANTIVNELDTKQPQQLVQTTTSSPNENRSTLANFLAKITSLISSAPAGSATPPPPSAAAATTSAPSLDTTTEPPEDDTSPGGGDNDAEDCQGVSAGQSAQAEGLTDNERLVNLQTCIQTKVKKRLLGATRTGLELFDRLSLSGACAASLMNLASSLAEIKSFAFKCKLVGRIRSAYTQRQAARKQLANQR